MASLKPPGLAPSQPGYQSTSPTSYAYKSTARKEAVSVYKEMDHKANQYIFYMETQRMVDRALLVSCFVTWCCNIVFGIIAFFVAWDAYRSSGLYQQGRAWRLARASLWISFIGILVTIIVAIVLVVVFDVWSISERNIHVNIQGDGPFNVTTNVV